MQMVSWSSVSSTGKVAFVTRDQGTYGRNKIQTISTSGGTPTVLYQSRDSDSHLYRSPCWSPDDSKIAFIDRAGALNVHAYDTIRVINASTGAEIETIPMPYSLYATMYIDWSRGTLNKLALEVTDTNTNAHYFYLYYLTPTSGSTPTTNNVQGEGPCWSPDNSSVILTRNTATWSGVRCVKNSYNTTDTTSVVTGAGYYGTWKR